MVIMKGEKYAFFYYSVNNVNSIFAGYFMFNIIKRTNSFNIIYL
jgi:hypothetical protein